MARMSDENLWRLIVPTYYLPTREAHSTLGAIFSRLDSNAVESGEGLIFNGAAQRDRADGALISAQNILLNVLDLQRECFHIQELEPLLQTCLADFIEIVKEQKQRDNSDGQQANSSGSA